MIRPQKRLIIILPMLIFAVVITILFVRKWSGDDRSVIKVSGNIELKDAQIGFKIAGRVLERMFSEGESIDSGQVVARPNSLDLAQEVALRKAGNSYLENCCPILLSACSTLFWLWSWESFFLRFPFGAMWPFS